VKNSKLISTDSISDNLLSSIESRDIALWVHSLPQDPLSRTDLINFLGLPWRLIYSEVYDKKLFELLANATNIGDPLTQKRGFVQIIDADPSRVDLPQRCLPIYLPNGREAKTNAADFESRLRKMTMLESLRRSGTREILVISGNAGALPSDLNDLWSSGFRSYLTFVSDSANAEEALEGWLSSVDGIAAANLVQVKSAHAIKDILARYAATYPVGRHVVRIRDQRGNFHRIDVTEADEPERPILESYSLIEERDLSQLTPEELSENDLIAFFKDSGNSWRPYAAGLPWVRESNAQKNLIACIKKLDSAGADSNCVAYISSESGAGGTTLARALAWEMAHDGYPVLIAKPLPFAPDPLPIVNFFTRVGGIIQKGLTAPLSSVDSSNRKSVSEHEPSGGSRRYETPWVIVFDSLHWQNRDSELARFCNEMRKSGRPVCVLVVTGTVLGSSYFNTSVFKRVAELNHSLDEGEARALGRHLNRFLRVYGRQRQDTQWDQFYKEHTIRYLDGISAFWVTLSFWIQGQYNLNESIQEWIFRIFKEFAKDRVVKDALLEIAAMSSERLPLPEGLLPVAKGAWPVSHLLEDSRTSLSALGLVRFQANGERHWALIHDILGRFLINALFYDFPMRDELGYSDAKDAEHLRFLVLQKVSQKRELGERVYRSIGEDFATSIFKIDPDHGYGSYVSLWRDVLESLDAMPRTLRDTSRTFRHHTAISRRRIAKLNASLYSISNDDRIAALNAAINDLNYAINFIEYTAGSESNVNLFNSLANALLDLAAVEFELGHSKDRIVDLRRLANEAAQRAYAESPNNSFVVETYVKNLLEGARESSELALRNCIEALGVLYSALIANETTYRRSQLGSLADQALSLLFNQSAGNPKTTEPRNAIDVLVNAWQALGAREVHINAFSLSEMPDQNIANALEALAHPMGRGNMQVIRLTFDLICVCNPYSFKAQLELVEQLSATDYRMAPQLRLEYAILLFQNGRAVEGDKVFRALRQIWRDSEQFVQVPTRLRWLRSDNIDVLQILQATTGSDYGNKSMARVQQFGNTLVPFRPEEFGFRELKPGLRFACIVSFGHNGPFLRPVTAHRSIPDIDNHG
jgi:hypothetical protein